MFIDRRCDPPSAKIPRGEVSLRVQPSRRHHRQPQVGAAGSGRGRREAGEDEEGGMSETQKSPGSEKSQLSS